MQIYSHTRNVKKVVCRQNIKKAIDTGIKKKDYYDYGKKAKELLKQNCHYGWAHAGFIKTARNKPKKDK